MFWQISVIILEMNLVQQKTINMTNKEKFLQKLKNENLELGIYNEEIDKLSTEELNRVIEQVVYEHTDVSITLDGIKRVIEFAQVDDEVDLTFMTEKAYVAQYG